MRSTSDIRRLPVLAVSTVVLFAIAIALIFFWAPTDPDQGLSQRIFYFHVPIALTAYTAFGVGAWKALMHLWKRKEGADLESYVAIHQGVIFGSLTLITGSLWAKISWGTWWVWSDDQLVLFLVLFLFYCAYFMLRYSVDAGPSRANMCAVDLILRGVTDLEVVNHQIGRHVRAPSIDCFRLGALSRAFLRHRVKPRN